jgi:hypothetical protein
MWVPTAHCRPAVGGEALLVPAVHARSCAALNRRSAACSTSPPALPSASAIADGATDGKNSVSCASACAQTAQTANPVQPKERSRTAPHSLRRGVCPHCSVMGRTACCFVSDAIVCGAAGAGTGSGFGAACARNMLPGGSPQHSELPQQINQSVTVCACVSCESVWWTCRARSGVRLSAIPS